MRCQIILVKQVVSIVLLIAFITVSFSKVILVGYYELNKKQITEQFCVNKDKPQMHCCGKCMLKKKLAEQEQQKSPVVPDLKNEIQLFHSPLTINIVTDLSNGINISSPYTFVYQTGVNGSVFHPPCA